MHTTLKRYRKWLSMFLTAVMLFSIVSPQLASANTTAVTLAKWAFNKDPKLTATDGISANLDKQLSIESAVLTGYNAGPSGVTVPNSNNWTNSNPFWKVSFSTKGYQNITLDSKHYSSATGPKEFKIQYSVDNNNWLDVPNGVVPAVATNWTSGVVNNLLLPAEVNDRDEVYVRWILASTTAVNGSALSNTGTNRIADIVFQGVPTGSAPIQEPVPTPPTEPTPIVKTATPDATKMNYSSYTAITGAAGAVAGNSQVNVYFDTNTLVNSITANADGSFAITIANPQFKSSVQVASQENGKELSDKVTVNYTGIIATPPPTTEIKPGDVVFSQIYPNGGNSGAFYKTKFFELYNTTDRDIDLSTWSIAYTSASNMTFGAGQGLTGVLKAKSYFLVAGNTGTNGATLPVPADVTISLNPSGTTGGALVLAKKKTAVTGVNDPDAIDLLAYTNGSASYKSPTYWGQPIVAQNIGNGTILRKTNIGTDPRSAFGMGNGWFTKDPSQDFVINTLSGTNAATEIVVRNSKTMLTPDRTKINLTAGTITGEVGSVPASATVKVYVESNGNLTNVQQAVAGANGSFTIALTNASATVVYLTHTDATTIESHHARINAAGTTPNRTDLAELRKSTENGVPIHIGYQTTIEGTVTTDNGADTNVRTNFFIQDATGAIQVVNNADSSVAIQKGHKYSIDGRVVFNAGMTQFIPTAIRHLGEASVPVAEEITIQSLTNSGTAEPIEGKLVTISGKVTNIPTEGPIYDITVSDENGNLTIVRLKDIKDIEADANYRFTGIVGQAKKASPFTSGYFLEPRTTSDVKGELVLIHLPLEKAYVGIDVHFRAVARNAEAIVIYYKGENDTTYQTANMTTADGRNYNGKIPQANMPVGKLYYYLQAVSGEETKRVGSESDPIIIDVVEDKDGPAYYQELPMNGEVVESKIPVISVKLEDANGINTSSVKISIDGKDFTSKAAVSETELKLTLTRVDELSEGERKVEVTAKDKLGNSSTFSWTFTVAKRFVGGNHYYGTTHNHTNISHDATGTPEDSLKAALRYGYDFYVFSDHSHDIDPEIRNTDTVDRKGMKERLGGTEWQLTKNLSKQYTKDGEFVVFPGFEMTSTTWGHSNVIGTENFVDRLVDGGTYQQLQSYYKWTTTYEDLVAQFNHPKMSANAFGNFIPYDKNVDKLFTMMELGNGSGNYSYATAEDKFHSALDLGWKIAPTYGEDNHDGTWGQTKRRTVVVTDDLTTESLMDAMRKMRVYTSEDPNFELDFMASGFYMGSTVDTDTLEFSIKGKDEVLEKATDSQFHFIKTASNDAVAKVELITNSGRVIDTYIPTEESTSFNWEPTVTVAGGQQWFVVRVTQKDGDRVFSAPIWSQQKDLAVNVSNITVAEGAMIGGVPATLTAGIGNQGIINVGNVTAKFYYDEVTTANLIGEATIDQINSYTSSTASVVWANPVPGQHKIIVVLSLGDGNDLGANKYEQLMNVQAPLNKVVMIDGSHLNENTKQDLGTYKDNFKLFTLALKQQGYTIVENSAVLTEQALSNVHVLVITNPTTPYSTAEIAAINTFVQNGGSLLVTGKSNFGGSNQNLNGLMAGVGSTIQINNDGVFDETKEGNFWSNPLTAVHAVRLHPKPVNNLLTDFVSTVEFFSGSSLTTLDSAGNKAPLTDNEKVTVLVRGNESTYQSTGSIKADTVVYNERPTYVTGSQARTDITGGSQIPIVASEQIGNGRIFVSGMNIFNDRQMDQSFSPKGNQQFSLNAVKWLANLELKTAKAADTRKLPDYTQTVVEGVVTTGAGVFFDAFYIQDETGGIMAYNEVPAGSLKPGDRVRVYGHIKDFENNIEIIFENFNRDVIKLGSGEPVQPKVVTTGEAHSEANQGVLVKTTGTVTKIVDDSQYIVNDGTGEAVIFIDGYIVGQSGPIPSMKVGDTFEVVGISGKYSAGDRIRVRDTRELKVTEGTTPVDPEPTPVDPEPTPVDPEPTPVDPEPTPVDPEPTPVDPEPTPVDPNPTPVDPNPAPADPNPTPVDPNPTPVNPNPAPVDPNPTPVNPNPIPSNPGPVVPNPGPVSPTHPFADVKAENGMVKVTVDDVKLANFIKNQQAQSKLEITIPAANAGKKANVEVNAASFALLQQANSSFIVEINNGNFTYKLPVKEIAIDVVSKQLGVNPNDVKLIIAVNETTDTANAIATNKLATVSKVVDFSIIAKAGEQTLEIKRFAKHVEREIILDKTVNPARVTVVRLNDNGTYTAVPSKLVGNKAVFMSLTNSKYVVVERDIQFTDLDKAWNRADIETLAVKGVINGYSDGSFKPNATTTRLQFVLMLTRGLGLSTDHVYDGRFKDVLSNSNDAAAVMAAIDAGIIKGKTADTFAPNEAVTREQAALMVKRALDYLEVDANKADTSKKVSSFKDLNKISAYAKADIEFLLQTDIISGKADGTFDPRGKTTRAQIAKMLNKVLEVAEMK